MDHGGPRHHETLLLTNKRNGDPNFLAEAKSALLVGHFVKQIHRGRGGVRGGRRADGFGGKLCRARRVVQSTEHRRGLNPEPGQIADIDRHADPQQRLLRGVHHRRAEQFAAGLRGAQIDRSGSDLHLRFFRDARAAGLVLEQLFRATQRDFRGVELHLRLFHLSVGVDLRLGQLHQIGGGGRGQDGERGVPGA